MLLSCPSNEMLFEFVTIPAEESVYRRTSLKFHLLRCKTCREKSISIKNTWSSYFKPQPDVTPSLMSVYSRLKNDETLILKGWKLGEAAHKPSIGSFLFNRGWLFRGAVSAGLAGVILVVITTQTSKVSHSDTTSETMASNRNNPMAQIRLENKNGVRVQYLKPELLQTIEFETMRSE